MLTKKWQLDLFLNQSRVRYVSPVDLAILYAQLGEREEAIASLMKPREQRAPKVLWIRVEPAFDSFASDPHYQQIVAKLPIS